VKKPLDEKQ